MAERKSKVQEIYENLSRIARESEELDKETHDISSRYLGRFPEEHTEGKDADPGISAGILQFIKLELDNIFRNIVHSRNAIGELSRESQTEAKLKAERVKLKDDLSGSKFPG